MKRLSSALMLVLAACSTRTVFRFQPSPRSAAPPIVAEGVAVPDFVDARGRRAIDHNLKFLALIPLVPFAVSHRDYPERTYFDTSRNLNGFVPPVDIAHAFAEEIEGRRIFARCVATGTARHGERYELRGRLDDCHVAEGYLTYGLSLASVVLHLIGFPEGTLRCVLQVHVELVDRRDRSVVWKGEYRDVSTRATWIYASQEADLACAAFSRIASSIVREAAGDLARAMEARAAGDRGDQSPDPSRLETSSSRPR